MKSTYITICSVSEGWPNQLPKTLKIIPLLHNYTTVFKLQQMTRQNQQELLPTISPEFYTALKLLFQLHICLVFAHYPPLTLTSQVIK